MTPPEKLITLTLTEHEAIAMSVTSLLGSAALYKTTMPEDSVPKLLDALQAQPNAVASAYQKFSSAFTELWAEPTEVV